MEIVKTRTGNIFYDREKRLEFLSVGDYGQENNVKADFLGLTKQIDGVMHKPVDKSKKWVITVSTQKGCMMDCNFCDASKYGYYGNVICDELEWMIRTAISYENISKTERLNIHFARMGEPTFNKSVLSFTRDRLPLIAEGITVSGDVHPVVSTMMPKGNPDLASFLHDWCDIKNNYYGGNAGLQLSMNSTSDRQRSIAFRDRSYGINEISKMAGRLPSPAGRKYTLNFAVTKDTVLNADMLTGLFDKDKFLVKITPVHETAEAKKNGYEIGDTYEKYSVYEKFEQPLLDLGWDVIVFIPSKEEDADRITCGNALIADRHTS